MKWRSSEHGITKIETDAALEDTFDHYSWVVDFANCGLPVDEWEPRKPKRPGSCSMQRSPNVSASAVRRPAELWSPPSNISHPQSLNIALTYFGMQGEDPDQYFGKMDAFRLIIA